MSQHGTNKVLATPGGDTGVDPVFVLWGHEHYLKSRHQVNQAGRPGLLVEL